MTVQRVPKAVEEVRRAADRGLARLAQAGPEALPLAPARRDTVCAHSTTDHPSRGPTVADLSQTVLRVMVHMTLADRRVQTSEVEMISEVHEQLFGASASRDDVERVMDEITAHEGSSLDEILREAAGSRSVDERHTILRAAACVSVADRSLHRDEKILLIRIATRLGLSPEHVSELLSP